MNIYSFYDLKTGLFNGRSISCPSEALSLNLIDGHGCVVGEYDRMSEKVDVETGLVIAYIPEQPSKNHEWDDDAKRWKYIETDADIAEKVRNVRDEFLTASDWVVARAIETGEPISATWAAYRKSLREITKQSGFPRSVTWPAKPESK